MFLNKYSYRREPNEQNSNELDIPVYEGVLIELNIECLGGFDGHWYTDKLNQLLNPAVHMHTGGNEHLRSA